MILGSRKLATFFIGGFVVLTSMTLPAKSFALMHASESFANTTIAEAGPGGQYVYVRRGHYAQYPYVQRGQYVYVPRGQYVYVRRYNRHRGWYWHRHHRHHTNVYVRIR